MSVMNQMLKDLEERRSLKQRLSTLAKLDLESVFSEGAHIPRRYFKIILISGFVVLLGLGIYYFSTPAAIQPKIQISQAPVVVPPISTVSKTTEISSTVTPLAVQNTPIKTLEMHPVSEKDSPPLAEILPANLEELVPALPPSPAPVLVKIKREPSKAERAETFFQESLTFIERQQFEEAVQKLQESLALLPNHQLARETDVKLKFRLGRLLEAEQSLERGLTATPRHLPFIQLKARLWVEAGEPKKALSFLIKHQTLGRLNPDHLSFMATLYQQEGQNAEAIPLYQQALRIESHHWRSRMGLGIALEAEGRFEEALDAYKTASAHPELDKESREFIEKRILVLRKP